jgi:hypothetical protein
VTGGFLIPDPFPAHEAAPGAVDAETVPVLERAAA